MNDECEFNLPAAPFYLEFVRKFRFVSIILDPARSKPIAGSGMVSETVNRIVASRALNCRQGSKPELQARSAWFDVAQIQARRASEGSCSV